MKGNSQKKKKKTKSYKKNKNTEIEITQKIICFVYFFLSELFARNRDSGKYLETGGKIGCNSFSMSKFSFLSFLIHKINHNTNTVLGLKEEKFHTRVRRQGKAKNSNEKANGDGRKFPPRHYVARG